MVNPPEIVHTKPLTALPGPAPRGEPKPPPLTNDQGKQICGAKRTGGKVCHCTMLYPNGRCRMHGGPALKGAASRRFKHGRYSQYMPDNLIGAYKRAEGDPALLSLRSDVAVLTALAEDALRTMSGDCPPWDEAADLIRQLGPLKPDQPLDADRIELIGELRDLIEKGADKVAAWEQGRKELKDCIKRKTDTAAVEHKRLHDQSLALPVEQATSFVSAMIEAAKAVIKPKDEALYRELMMETAKLLPARPGEKRRMTQANIVLDVSLDANQAQQ